MATGASKLKMSAVCALPSQHAGAVARNFEQMSSGVLSCVGGNRFGTTMYCALEMCSQFMMLLCIGWYSWSAVRTSAGSMGTKSTTFHL
eukprot:5832480-Amphidinium_carterae.3